MYTHARRQLLYIKISEQVFKCVSEWHLYGGSVDAENGGIVGRGQRPVLCPSTCLKILDTDAVGIDSDGLRKRFGKRFQESPEFLGLIGEEILSEVFDETIIDFGFVFFHFLL